MIETGEWDGKTSTPEADPQFNRYQLTLSHKILPIWVICGLNLVGGLCLGLEGAPLLGAVWAAASCGMDAVFLDIYRRRLAAAATVDPEAGLNRLAVLVTLRSIMWMAAPTGFALLSRAPVAIAQTAITALGLATVAMTSGWTSRPIFYARIGPVILSMGMVCLFLFPPLQATGLLIALGVFGLLMDLVSTTTHRAVDEWSKSHSRMLGALGELREALRQAQATKRRLKIAVRLADLFIYEIDYVEGTLVTMGDESDFFEKPPTFESLVSNPLGHIHPDDRSGAVAAWRASEASGTPLHRKYRIARSDGREVWAAAAAEVRRDLNGAPLSAVGAMRNITPRMQAQLESVRAREAAEAASQAKSDFLANMSHEIRTPLNGVLGMVQVMERDDPSPVQRQRLGIIRGAGETLLVILNAILDMAKIESGKLALEITQFEISTTARRALDPFVALAQDKGVALTCAVAPDADGLYQGDATRVGQILHNLVSNAVKFTSEGGVGLDIQRHDGKLQMRVSDTGVGIDPAKLGTIFERFSKADATVTRRHGGTGLGLAIASELAAQMGGAIAVESRPGQGSTFTVTLPLPLLQTSRSGPAGGRDPADAPQDVLPVRALVGGASPA